MRLGLYPQNNIANYIIVTPTTVTLFTMEPYNEEHLLKINLNVHIRRKLSHTFNSIGSRDCKATF